MATKKTAKKRGKRNATRGGKAAPTRGIKTRRVKLSDLHLDPANARKHGKRNLETIRGSLKRFGQVEPLVVQRGTGRVIGGNGRLKVMLADGETHADVVEVDANDAKAAALAIALNRTAELAEWDVDVLGTIAPTLDADLLGDIGFDMGELNKVLGRKPEVTQDEVPEPPKNAVTKLGDVWTLGRHRVVCGDCAEVELPEPYELLVTDPPYGVSYADKNQYLNAIAPGNRIQEPIKGDHHFPEEMSALWARWFTAVRHAAKPGASYYVTGPQGGDLLLLLLLALRESGFPLRHMLIWAKNNHVLGRCDFNYKHEPILFGWVEGAGHRFHGGDGLFSLWEIDKPHQSKLHPTMKPVALFAKAIGHSSTPGDIVADPFLGSGTTLIAAEHLDRVCYGIELSPNYCDVIVERWQNLTGKKAKREKG